MKGNLRQQKRKEKELTIISLLERQQMGKTRGDVTSVAGQDIWLWNVKSLGTALAGLSGNSTSVQDAR